MAIGSKLVGIATGIVVRKVSDKALSAAWKKTKHPRGSRAGTCVSGRTTSCTVWPRAASAEQVSIV